MTYSPKVPADLAINPAYLAVRALLALFRKHLAQFGQAAPSEASGGLKVWLELIGNLPRLAAFLLFVIIAIIIFLFLAGAVESVRNMIVFYYTLAPDVVGKNME